MEPRLIAAYVLLLAIAVGLGWAYLFATRERRANWRARRRSDRRRQEKRDDEARRSAGT